MPGHNPCVVYESKSQGTNIMCVSKAGTLIKEHRVLPQQKYYLIELIKKATSFFKNKHFKFHDLCRLAKLALA
jgi:hypothetical protein